MFLLDSLVKVIRGSVNSVFYRREDGVLAYDFVANGILKVKVLWSIILLIGKLWLKWLCF